MISFLTNLWSKTQVKRKTIESSKELYLYYKAWAAVVGVGNPQGVLLCLCGFVELAQRREMRAQFSVAGLNKFYPFNKTSEDFRTEGRLQAFHLNPARVQWVRDRIADYEKEHGL